MHISQVRFRILVCFVTALAACLWVGYERLFAPQLSAQEGVTFCILFGLVAWILASPKFFKRFVGESTPATLGLIRIVACACMLVVVFLLEDVPTTALLPEVMKRPMGVVEFFYLIPGFATFVRSQAALQVFEWLTGLCLILGMVGWRTRIVVPLGALGGCLIGGITRQYFFSFYHQGLIPVYMLAILSLTPCGDGLSVDRWLRIYRGQSVPDANRPLPIYAWSRYACWALLVLAYMASGTSKLKTSGLEWLHPTNLRGMMYGCTLQRCNNYDWDLSLQFGPYLPDFVYFLFGLLGTFGEIAFITVLFSALSRRVMPLLMVALHVGIFFFQNIIFVEFVVLQLIFVDYTRMRQAIARRVQAKYEITQVFYDGASSVCCRSAQLLGDLDWFNRLECLDIRQIDLEQYNSSKGLDLTLNQLESTSCVVAKGKLYCGVSAYSKLTQALPVLWWMVPFLSISAIALLGNWFHQHLLRYLQLVPGQAQQVPHSRFFHSSTLKGSTRPAFVRGHGYRRFPLLIATLTVVFTICWFYRFYFYPLTGLHLFAYKDISGVVLYNKIYATNALGEIFRIYPEDIIRAQAVASPRRVTNFCFYGDPSSFAVCDGYLRALGTVHNKTADPDQAFRQLEVQRWEWAFLENPLDKNYGQVVERYSLTVDLPESKAEITQ